MPDTMFILKIKSNFYVYERYEIQFYEMEYDCANKGVRISAMNSVRMKENFKLRTQSGKCSTAQSLKSSS